MPGLAHINEQFSSASSELYSASSANGFWSKNRADVSHNQLQKFWSGLSPKARRELMRIDKPTLFEQARKNMYCSRCNGLLLEGFLQIVMYGRSLQQEGADVIYNRLEGSREENDSGLSVTELFQDELQDPTVHPWGGLTSTRDGSLTVLDCYLCSESLKALQIVFDSAHARERERELLYPDACGGGGRGWISQGMVSYGRGHGTRETCALHTARLSCDALVDFWSALGDETRQSLLKMKEEDFVERLMYRFDSKRFCRDCRRNVIREFKELKELKRIRREPRCTIWFCVADTAFQCEVSYDTVRADWRQTFADSLGTYHHFEWAVGTGEGKSDIQEFENVGTNVSAEFNGLNLASLGACFITLRAWKLDGRYTELSVRAQALNGQRCVHSRLIVGDGFVTMRQEERIRSFFERAEEAEEEEDDDSVDKDENELGGECSRPQKHAKSPELAREFLLDAATVIYKEQVEKAFREGTARQNAHSIFVCLALKLLEERLHIACKDISTMEKQMKLLEEEEKEKRDEEARKERRRTKDKEKKLRRKERLKGKEKNCSEYTESPVSDVSKEEVVPCVDEEPINSFSYRDSVPETCDNLSRSISSDFQDEELPNGDITSRMQNHSYSSPDGEMENVMDGNGSFIQQKTKFSRQRQKYRKEVQLEPSFKCCEKRRFAGPESGVVDNQSEPRYYGENFVSASRSINASNRQLRVNASKSNARNCSSKLHCSNKKSNDRYDSHSRSCPQNSEYRVKVEPHLSALKCLSNSESSLDISKQFYQGNEYSQTNHMHDGSGRPKSKMISGTNSSSSDLVHSRKIWEPMDAQTKYLRRNSDSDIIMRSSNMKVEEVRPDSLCSGDFDVKSKDNNIDNLKKSENGHVMKDHCYSKETCQEEHESFPITDSSHFPNMSCTSTSDNCSSCHSEGDGTLSSSSTGNLESSTSDSEDIRQQSEIRENAVSIENDLSKCQEVIMETTWKTNVGDNCLSREAVSFHLDAAGSNPYFNPPPKGDQNLDNATNLANMGVQHQRMTSSVHNQNLQRQNLHYPLFQATSMSYYRQNPVSWAATPVNGLMSFAQPNPYLYTSSLGYGLNGNSPFVQYGAPAPHNVDAPITNLGPVPVYQPVSNSSAGNLEHPQVCKPAVAQGVPHKLGTLSKGEAGRNDNLVKSHTANAGFSLFHFGGPVALSTGLKSRDEEIVGDISAKLSGVYVKGDHDCNKQETAMKEYNLFAKSNGIRFSIF